jgi:phosphomethylpyrimidine synthase
MKISAEVREFARLNPPRTGEGDQAELGGGVPTPAAEAGMAEMSRAYNEGGRELYIGAGGREHD